LLTIEDVVVINVLL